MIAVRLTERGNCRPWRKKASTQPVAQRKRNDPEDVFSSSLAPGDSKEERFAEGEGHHQRLGSNKARVGGELVRYFRHELLVHSTVH